VKYLLKIDRLCFDGQSDRAVQIKGGQDRTHELSDIYGGMMQFMVLQVIALLAIVLFPGIALGPPHHLFT